MVVSLFTVICVNYNFDEFLKKKKFRQQREFSDYIFYVYNQFLNQSFDYNFNDEEFQKTLTYCYKFKNFILHVNCPCYTKCIKNFNDSIK